MQQFNLSIPPWFDCGSCLLAMNCSSAKTFNPTLVRLRPCRQMWKEFYAPFLSIPPWFDCGAGAARNGAAPSRFQSHLGSIAAAWPLRGDGSRGHFQSHLGSIAAGIPYPRLRAALVLSIPPWFDCGAAASWRSGDRGSPFNPTLVRLRHLCGITCPPHPSAFQSHLGSIAAGLALPCK